MEQPAVSTGPNVVNAIVNGGTLSDLWIYWVGPFLGGAVAAGVFRLQEEGIKPVEELRSSTREFSPADGLRN